MPANLIRYIATKIPHLITPCMRHINRARILDPRIAADHLGDHRLRFELHLLVMKLSEANAESHIHALADQGHNLVVELFVEQL